MPSRIVYLSWPAHEISGGIKLTYRHVEALRAAELEAVVATPDGKAPTWFDTSAPSLSLGELRPAEDILVFPENHYGMLNHFRPWPNRKVVFCQNQFMAHRGLNGAACYGDFGVTEILAEGREVVDFCERRFPRLIIYSVPVYVETSIFRVAEKKQLQIAFAPRKRPLEAEMIRDLFRAQNPEFRDLPWIPISDRSEKEVAEILGASAVYLALCRFEAFPLSILEAFASGCIVAGFTGFGGRVYATSENGFWAADDDCSACAEQLARAVRTVTRGWESYSEMVNAAVAVTRRFSHKRFCERIVQYWRPRVGA